jgi:predicted transport protein
VSDIRLFRYTSASATELAGKAAAIEKTLQRLIEAQMETLLGVRFLATEYGTGNKHRGRIDSLGLDENGCPVIIEYKRHSNENVINQGLFYLDWLLDHKADFRLLVMDTLGKAEADRIEWSGTRLLCIAADFTRYDEHAVAQINRNIELIRYKLFSDDLLLFELVNGASAASQQSAAELASVAVESATANEAAKPVKTPAASTLAMKTHTDQIATASQELLALFEQTRSFILAQGDDIIEKPVKLYVAYRRIKNFVCMSLISKQDPHLFLILKLDPATVLLEPGFTRDVRKIGHWGTGDLELTLRTRADLERARPLIERAYTEN